MYCYLHAQSKTNSKKILQNPDLVFTANINPNTGELGNGKKCIIYTANYRELVIKYHEFPDINLNFIQIRGSLHKYYHAGANFADFNLLEVQKALFELCNFLQIEPKDTTIHGLEFGVNIHLKQSTEIVLNSFISYMSKPYQLEEFNSKGYLKRFNFTHFDIKLYDKGLHYKLSDNLLRYELKVKRMAYLNTKGIFINNMLDLLNFGIINKLQTLLVNVFSDIMFFDDAINLKSITNQKDKEFILNGINCQFWTKEKNKLSDKGYKNKVKRFKIIAQKYGALEYKNIVLNTIADKWTALKSTPMLQGLGVEKVPQYFTYVECNNMEQTTNYCLSCGRDISKQRSNSKYCRYKINGKEIKDCKNYATNFFEHDLKFYPKHQLLLINIDNYLHPKKFKLKQAAFKSYKVQ